MYVSCTILGASTEGEVNKVSRGEAICPSPLITFGRGPCCPLSNALETATRTSINLGNGTESENVVFEIPRARPARLVADMLASRLTILTCRAGLKVANILVTC